MKRSKTALEGGRRAVPDASGRSASNRSNAASCSPRWTPPSAPAARTLASITTPGAIERHLRGDHDPARWQVRRRRHRHECRRQQGLRDRPPQRGRHPRPDVQPRRGGEARRLRSRRRRRPANNDDIATGVAVQPDDQGKIVVSGVASGGHISLTRLLPNGDFDLSFEVGRQGQHQRDPDSTDDNPVLSTVSVAIQILRRIRRQYRRGRGQLRDAVLRHRRLRRMPRACHRGSPSRAIRSDPGTHSVPDSVPTRSSTTWRSIPRPGRSWWSGWGSSLARRGDTFEPDIGPDSPGWGSPGSTRTVRMTSRSAEVNYSRTPRTLRLTDRRPDPTDDPT